MIKNECSVPELSNFECLENKQKKIYEYYISFNSLANHTSHCESWLKLCTMVDESDITDLHVAAINGLYEMFTLWNELFSIMIML